MALMSYKALSAYAKKDDYTLMEGILVKGNKDDQKAISLGFASSDSMDRTLRVLIWYPLDANNADEARNMMSRLKRIPQTYLKTLVQKDVAVRFVNYRITDDKAYQDLRGITPRGWENTGKTWDDIMGIGVNPVVARIGYSDPSEHHGSINLELHELAHAIDYYVFSEFGNSSDDVAFQKLADIERKNLFGTDPYFLDYSEYFSETFAMFYCTDESREMLRRNAPKTYSLYLKMENKVR